MGDIREALKHIDARSLTYDEWLKVGMALHTEGEPCSLWEDWSRNDPSRFHEGECQKKWESFHGCAVPVTGKSIIHLAMQNGYTPSSFGKDGAMDWDDCIDLDIEPFESSDVQNKEALLKPTEELGLYLKTLFAPDELVCYVTQSIQDDDGKYKPRSSGFSDRTAGELLASLEKYPDDIGATIGDWDTSAGAWIRFNPVDGKGVKNTNVTQYKYALVESDSMPIQEQDSLYRKLELPIAALVHSGGKSLHAICRIDAKDYDEYRKRVEFLYGFLEKNGLVIDRQNRNPSRLSRLPGVVRGEKRQKLVAVNIGRKSWTEWLDFAEGTSDELPDLVKLSDFPEMPKPPEELIEGVLRLGHKMLISGSSKAGKSFLLMELCVAIAEGKDWLGFKCRPGKVLYVNLEIDPASCIGRFIKIYDAKGINRDNASNIVIWNLRGHAVPLDELVPKLVRRVKDEGYAAVVIDPLYKVITGDENNARDMAAFCNQFDKICTETGCSVIYCHHHSKGAQGSKRAIDRASGSGVFARDPDAQLDMIELELTDELKNRVRDGYATAWRMESSLREFANFEPINFWFEFPIHRVDNEHLKSANAQGSKRANLSKSSKRTTEQDRKETLDSAFEICAENGFCKVVDIAEYTGLTRRTISNYLSDYADEYMVENGVVTRK